MNAACHCWLGAFLLVAGGSAELSGAEVVFEGTSAYHHIQVIDEDGVRTLSFDGSMETRMSLENPLQGHFGYTEFFHMPWLWNSNLSRVLMIGLGGGSTQRAYEHYYPNVEIDTAELDPMVLRVARSYFQFRESARQRVHVEDGRVFLRRTQQRFDVIIVDAYRTTRYGSFIPYPLATREFFELTSQRLTTNGVLAYNIIGSVNAYQADIVGAVYRTMRTVYPQVYLFPARDSENVVLLATKSAGKMTQYQLNQRVAALARTRQPTLPNLRNLVSAFRDQAPFSAKRSSLLTDDFAPVDGMLRSGRVEPAPKPPER